MHIVIIEKRKKKYAYNIYIIFKAKVYRIYMFQNIYVCC